MGTVGMANVSDIFFMSLGYVSLKRMQTVEVFFVQFPGPLMAAAELPAAGRPFVPSEIFFTRMGKQGRPGEGEQTKRG